MTTVHILSQGFVTPNSRGLLFPLIVHREALRDIGIQIRIFTSPTRYIMDCDLLMVDSKYYSPRWQRGCEAVLAELANFRERIEQVIYVDVTDSTSWDHARVLPVVTGFLKNQLLRDRELYLKPLYGNRIYTDFYHRREGVEDTEPQFSEPVGDPKLLNKLAVGWNFGLADYSFIGRYRMELYRRVPWPLLLAFPGALSYPGEDRVRSVFCRFGVNYARESVSWQRRRILEGLSGRASTERVSRRAYFQELRESKVVLSPFGFGEICFRDFEAMLSGALLFKPDMSHVETWPDLYRDGETMISHHWDLSDFAEKLETILADYRSYVHVAAEAQRRYLNHISGRDARDMFCDRFANILRWQFAVQAPCKDRESGNAPVRADSGTGMRP